MYVATNPAMPGLVKIGVTERDDPQERIQQLFATNVPLPFDLEYAAAVDLPPRQVERALHTAFAPQRVHAGREFYRIDPEQAIAVLRLVAVRDMTGDAQAQASAAAEPADVQATKQFTRRESMNFDGLGIKPGEILTFERDGGVQVRVADEGGQRVCIVALPADEFAPHPANADRSVSEGRVDSLAKITADLFGYEYMSALHHWRLEDGRLLKDVYEEAHAAD
ncbi:MAG: GIY-YIG nuclease family protein [Acidimicrobiales bacterium]|nr:GIY-YIG nuclease family protein [Acidimicrobiales bacterium]MYG89526.1 GIY-YIG nuclease family protein [Acidimicrobiales bacterium]MYI29551.1 GIY-YIG nuclease family protein [Acidimicrobiales bacterium]